jgi:hypothetical protein
LLLSSSHRLLIIHSPQTHPKILKKGAGFTNPGGKNGNQCSQCRKLGHFKWEYPERKKEEMIIPLMTQRKRDHLFGPFCSSQIIPHYVPLQAPGLSLFRMAHNFQDKEKEIQCSPF